jgi:hypothetical protein
MKRLFEIPEDAVLVEEYASECCFCGALYSTTKVYTSVSEGDFYTEAFEGHDCS